MAVIEVPPTAKFFSSILCKSHEWPWRKVGGLNPPKPPRGFAADDGRTDRWNFRSIRARAYVVARKNLLNCRELETLKIQYWKILLQDPDYQGPHSPHENTPGMQAGANFLRPTAWALLRCYHHGDIFEGSVAAWETDISPGHIHPDILPPDKSPRTFSLLTSFSLHLSFIFTSLTGA